MQNGRTVTEEIPSSPKEAQRVQHLGRLLQLLFLGSRQHMEEQEALQWGFGRVVDPTHLSAIVPGQSHLNF
jgi:hypothetical protein